MKKFLLSLFLLCAVFIGHSQVVLNEIYSNPGSGRNEFFELYNTDISTTPIQLDCYTLVVYYRQSASNRGFYVIDFPTSTIASKSYYVGASANTISVQGSNNVPTQLNWNNLGPAPKDPTGYIRKYRVNNNNTGYNDVSNEITANFNNVFDAVQGGGDVAVFLFSQGVYINGFAAGFNLGTALPEQIAGLPDITIPYANSSCGTSFTVNWRTQVTKVEYQSGGGSGGSDNGFARDFDGNCGSWRKTANSSNHTPGRRNGSATDSQVGFLTTNEKIICGNRIDYQITATTDPTALPVTVQLYEDNPTFGLLDGNDIFLTSQTVTAVSGTTTYSFPSLDPTKSYLVVYKTALGCLDKVEIPVASTGALDIVAKNICGSQIDFSIPSATGDAATYGIPVQVQLYDDNGTPAVFDPADVAIGDPITVSSISNALYSIPIPEENRGETYILVFTSGNACYSRTIVPQNAIGSITTTQLSICGNQVDFTVSGVTGDATAAYVLPITVNLYHDLNGDQVLDDDEKTPVATTQVTSLSSTVYTLTNPDPSKKMLIQYNTAQPCFTPFPPVAPTAAVGGLTTTALNVCGSQVDFTITAPTGHATAAYVFPITVELHYDIDGDQVLDLDPEEQTVRNTIQINSFSEAIHTITNPDPSKKLILVYRTAQECFSTTQFATPTTGAIATTQELFCGKRVNFTITGGSADAANYSLPIVVNVYHDANGNGILDENINNPAILLGTKEITSFSNTAHFIDLREADWGKAVIVAYDARFDCFNDRELPQITTSGPIEVSGNIVYSTDNGISTSTLNYFVVDAATAADAYPLELVVYEDIDRNGQINGSDGIIATQNLNAPAPSGTIYNVVLPNFRSSAIIVARSTVGCSQALEAIANTQAPLPVRLVSFTAKRNKEKVHLAWETSMELNNSGFDIQRKVGNGEWKTIAFMFSQANGGNSSSVLRYAYNDVNPAKGVSQYRLRQVDIDTRSTFSEIRSVRGMEQASQLLVYPNPSADGKVNIIFDEHSGSRHVIVSDISGRVVKNYQNIADNSLQIDGLQNGMYTLQIINAATGETTVEKVIIKKR